MSEREKKAGGAGCFLVGAVLTMLPVLYVLGIGPAAWTAVNYPATEKALEAVYSPLLILSDNCRPVSATLNWYMDLWGG